MASKRIILTDRLQLVPFAPEHTDDLFVMNSNPEVMRYSGDVQTLEDVKKNIARVQARWEKSGYGLVGCSAQRQRHRDWGCLFTKPSE